MIKINVKAEVEMDVFVPKNNNRETMVKAALTRFLQLIALETDDDMEVTFDVESLHQQLLDELQAELSQ